jgi:preprotein translocase subunit SecG
MTLTILYYVAITLHIVACFFLISVILLQQGKGQDLASAFGGGGSQAAFGPRGSANVLSRATTILAGVFMVTSLGLSLLRPQQRSVLDQLPAAASEPAPAASAPAATTAPAPAQQAPAPAATPASQ